jgi:putative PEP-CTERM system histidine kinase
MITFIFSIITAIVAIVIAFVVFLKRYNRLSHIAFFVSMLSTAFVIFGDSMCMLNPESIILWKRFVFIVEALMATSWLLFAMSFARADYWHVVSKFSKLLLMLSPLFAYFFIAIPIENFFLSPDSEFRNEKILFLGNTGYVFNLLLLLYSVVSIINLETTLRSSSGVNKWQIKYTVMGAGGIIAFNIFYYSYALLYRSINMDLLPVRDGIVLVSNMVIGFSILRHKAMDVEVAISRNILFRSLSIFIVGFYLLGLGLIGEGMRYLGPRAGTNITIFLGFIGAIVVLTIILSEQLRRKAIVFIHKNFYSYKYDYREQWLSFTQRISLKNDFDELLGSIAEGFKEAIGSTGAAIWLKGRDNKEYVCVKVLETNIVKAAPGSRLIEFLQNKKWILNVHDNECKTVVSDNKEFIEKTGASLIVPLIHIDRLIGFIILRESLAENEYNYEDFDLLKTLAKQASLAIVNTQLADELIEAKEMEAMGRLSSFIIHDLKNSASMLSMIAQNSEEHIDNPDFQRDAMRAVSNTSEKIRGIIDKLKNLPIKAELHLKYYDLCECVKSAIAQVGLNGKANLSYKEIENVSTKFDNEELSKVIINLIMNAFDATGMKGEIKISTGTENGAAFIRVSDNGCGMSTDFIDRNLFRPFQTTKKKGLGIGLYQCKTIIEAHSGRMLVESQEGRGTEFIIYLPIISH